MEKEKIDVIVRDLKPMWKNGYTDYVQGALTVLSILGHQKESEIIYEKVIENER